MKSSFWLVKSQSFRAQPELGFVSFQEGVLELVVSSIQSSWQQAKVRAAGKMEAMIWISGYHGYIYIIQYNVI